MTDTKGNPRIFKCWCAAHKKCEFPYPILQLSLCSEDTYKSNTLINQFRTLVSEKGGSLAQGELLSSNCLHAR